MIVRALESAFVPFSPVRRLELPRGAAVIGVGGARFGGCGRTPLAIGLAKALSEHARVALVGHGYGAATSRAHIVRRDDPVALVGDEARIAAECLELPVVVAPSRREAITFAASIADVVLVDRLVQTKPVRLACSLLAHDGSFPHSWIAHVDERVHIGGEDAREFVDVPSVRGRVGLVTSLARPERVTAALANFGVFPVVHVARADHAPFSARELRDLARHRVDIWIVDAKTHVRAPELGVCIRHRVEPSIGLVERVLRCARLPRP